jgi:proteic killer suppression protein
MIVSIKQSSTSATYQFCIIELESYWLTLNAVRYIIAFVIKSFRFPETERLHRRQLSRRFQAIERNARRKLRQLDSATELRDLVASPGNRLEALHGDREGQYSIRINDQWRVCFIWREGNAYDVEIVDYH